MIDSCCVCRVGKVRSVNQDRAGCFSLESWCLAFVADGMGGHFGGERASEIVAQACSQWWEAFLKAPQRPGFLQSVEQLRSLLHRCHEEIKKAAPLNEVCGTTVVLLWISGTEYALFSVGDSRCYTVERRFGCLRRPVQLTHDDVAVEPRLAGKLLRALGPGECVFSLTTGQVRPGAVYALCSDGIYKACPELLAGLRAVSQGKKLKSAVEKITAQVDANGAPDNYSLVLLRT